MLYMCRPARILHLVADGAYIFLDEAVLHPRRLALKAKSTGV